jgi:chaperonin GroES
MAKAKIKPLSDRVLVQPGPAEEKTDSGIIIPDTAQEKPQEGEVIAAGPGKVENGTKIDMSVSEGDKVLYGKYSGTEISLDGQDYLIMRESDILGIVS